MTKKEKILKYLREHPDAAPKQVAAKLKTTRSTVYILRKQVRAEAEAEPEATDDFVVKYIDNAPASNRQVGGSHYKDMAVEPWTVVDSWPLEQRTGYYRGNALKYLMRMGTKDSASSDVAKAQHYMEKLLEVMRENI